jgi:hypothetical protein
VYGEGQYAQRDYKNGFREGVRDPLGFINHTGKTLDLILITT